MSSRRLVAALLLLAACATNPATGRRELSLVSQQDEIALGQQEAQKARAQMPALRTHPQLVALVQRMGRDLAARSERPQLPWSFDVLDDPAVNAFALPGGPIFVTRGILAHMNSEAELASVVGHEIGHVTGRHSASQMSKAQAAQLGLGIASILSPQAAQVAGIAQQGLGLLFLKYGRDDEREADALGFRYMTAANYDPREAASMFRMLARASGNASEKTPEWLSTHPDPGDRAERATERARATPPAKLDSLRRGRNEFLRLLDGLPYGENPREGFFRGQTFLHPDLAFQLTFPEGWQKQNQPQAVVAAEPNGAAMLQLRAGQGAPDAALRAFVGQQGITEAREADVRAPLGETRAAYFTAQSQQGPVGGIVAFVQRGQQTYQLLGLTAPQNLQALDGIFRRVAGSLAPVTDRAVLDVQAPTIRLVTLPRDMTAEEFVRAFPSSVPAEQVLAANGFEPGQRLTRGTLAKQIR